MSDPYRYICNCFNCGEQIIVESQNAADLYDLAKEAERQHDEECQGEVIEGNPDSSLLRFFDMQARRQTQRDIILILGAAIAAGIIAGAVHYVLLQTVLK